MKSHDHYHMLLDFWPIVLRGLVGKDVHRAISDLAEVLRSICAKHIGRAELPDLKIRTVEALCRMEMGFPTSFMTSNVHAVVHLVDELELCGPVSYKWMFYVERHMKVMKTMIRQQAKPKGSLAMGYLAKENMFYCSEFFGQIDHNAACMWSMKDVSTMVDVVLQGQQSMVFLTSLEQVQIRQLLVQSAKCFGEWREMYDVIDDDTKPVFNEWMQQQVSLARDDGDEVEQFGHELISLLYWPALQAMEAKKMWAYSMHIRTTACDELYITQDNVLRLDYWWNVWHTGMTLHLSWHICHMLGKLIES